MVGKNKLCFYMCWGYGLVEEENIVSEMTLQKSKIITAINTLEVQVTVGMYDGAFKEDFSE